MTLGWHHLILLSGLAATPLQANREGSASVRPEIVSQRMLDELVAINGVPGMGAAVWMDGKVVWTGSSGYADLDASRPVTRSTVFRLASVSKLFAVTAAAKLAEEGKLDLDAPIAVQLPWLRNDWPMITARQLAAHTSGLPHYQGQDVNRGGIAYPNARAATGIFANRPLLTAPGEAYSYSSWGYTLLGAMVEEGSGMGFSNYLSQRLVPRMRVGRDATDGPDPAASTAYDIVEGKLVRAARHDFSYTWSGGGLGGTPEAVARFGGAMAANRIVKRATFDRMLVPEKLNNGEYAGEPTYRIGFGWRIGEDRDGRPVVFHNGSALGARSSLVVWRGEGTAVSLLSNLSWISSIDLSAEMLAAPFRPQQAIQAAPCPVDVKAFRGTYDGKAVTGGAQFRLEGGLCIGELVPAGELGKLFKDATRATGARIRIVGIDGRGGVGRAGLVTPMGIYDWRAQANGGFLVRFSAKRSLELTLSE